jgi:hypothetical protein
MFLHQYCNLWRFKKKRKDKRVLKNIVIRVLLCLHHGLQLSKRRKLKIQQQHCRQYFLKQTTPCSCAHIAIYGDFFKKDKCVLKKILLRVLGCLHHGRQLSKHRKLKIDFNSNIVDNISSSNKALFLRPPCNLLRFFKKDKCVLK